MRMEGNAHQPAQSTHDLKCPSCGESDFTEEDGAIICLVCGLLRDRSTLTKTKTHTKDGDNSKGSFMACDYNYEPKQAICNTTYSQSGGLDIGGSDYEYGYLNEDQNPNDNNPEVVSSPTSTTFGGTRIAHSNGNASKSSEQVLGYVTAIQTPTRKNITCPSCRSDKVGQEDEGLMCYECGVLLDQTNLANDRNQELQASNTGYFASSLPKAYYDRNSSHHTCRGLKTGRNKIKMLGSSLNMAPHMIEEALGLFEAAFKNVKGVLGMHISTKEVIASVCVYMVSRKDGWPITKTDVAHLGGVQVNDMVHWSKILESHFALDLCIPDLEEIVMSTGTKSGFDEEVLKTSVDIIKMAKKVWMDSGRHPLPLIYASFFWAFLAHSKEKKITLNQFIAKHKVRVPKATIKTRSGEINTVLLQLGRHLPWIDINQHNLNYHILDIVANHRTLLYSISSEREMNNGAGFSTHKIEQEKMTQGKMTQDGDKKNRVTPEEEQDYVKSEIESGNSDTDSETGIRNLYLKKRKKRRRVSSINDGNMAKYAGDMDAPELSNLDIAPQDLHLYIKSDQEVNSGYSIPSGNSRL